jgi:hypothetical protein
VNLDAAILLTYGLPTVIFLAAMGCIIVSEIRLKP